MWERKNLPAMELKQRYEAGESLADLAAAYGCHRQTVGTRLREIGVTIRPRRNQLATTPDQIERMRELRDQGVKYEAIAMEVGVSAATVYVHLSAYRNPHRAALLEMLEILKEKRRGHLESLEFSPQPNHVREQRREAVSLLDKRIAALESVT